MKRILVTGGAGFIGSHFVDFLTQRYEDQVVVLDKLTYSGSLANLHKSLGRIRFVRGDIADAAALREAFTDGVDWVVNFAAETHVDNSIDGPMVFAETNFIGVLRLLMFSTDKGVSRFLQVSTDEVYGSRDDGFFKESDAQSPSSPYAATKSAAEKMVWAYHVTHELPVLITRSSNNYGPRQHPEKFMPKCILNSLSGLPTPVYGDGRNERDWLFVLDNCEAIDLVLRKGWPGTAYNIAAHRPMPNVDLARMVLAMTGASRDLIRFVEDRKGHDLRYAVDTTMIEQLGWRPVTPLDQGIAETIRWYRTKYAPRLSQAEQATSGR
jgi:dTDP-glucose 4,6-dehydratase